MYAGVPACRRVLLTASDTSFILEMPKSHTCSQQQTPYDELPSGYQ